MLQLYWTPAEDLIYLAAKLQSHGWPLVVCGLFSFVHGNELNCSPVFSFAPRVLFCEIFPRRGNHKTSLQLSTPLIHGEGDWYKLVVTWHLLFSFLGVATTKKEKRPISTFTATAKAEQRKISTKRTSDDFVVSSTERHATNTPFAIEHITQLLRTNKRIFNCLKQRQYDATFRDLCVHFNHNLFFFDVILFLRQRLTVKVVWEGFLDERFW